MTNQNDSAHHTPHPATPGERPSLKELDLSPQGLADAPAIQADPDSLVDTGNS